MIREDIIKGEDQKLTKEDAIQAWQALLLLFRCCVMGKYVRTVCNRSHVRKRLGGKKWL